MLEAAAADLGPLTRDVAFLGGAAMVLWISDPGAPPVRPTRDVDVIVEVATRVEYYALGERLRDRRFEENPVVRQLCAWKHRDSGLQLDVMPVDEAISGSPAGGTRRRSQTLSRGRFRRARASGL